MGDFGGVPPINSEKSWAFTSPGGGSGTFYIGGFYNHNIGDSNFALPTNFGTANAPYGAHLYVVLGAAAVDEITITVTGTSINDQGVRAALDTENIVIPNGTGVDSYFETTKKWLGQVSIQTTGGTAKTCNYGFAKYWDNNNNNFTVTGFEATFRGGANDNNPDIQIIHHNTTGWTFNAAGAADPPVAIVSMQTDYNTEFQIKNNQEGAWKRDNLNTAVEGNDSEGTIIVIITTQNNTFEIGNFMLRIRV
tara:strand:+ start:33 stop:782 length:750 start_codon:yes stop_codon:yes gene_type:complete